jgi:hypothetical protein
LEAIDDQSTEATITHHHIMASAILSFNKMGQNTELKADRYLGEQLGQWSGRYEEYQEVDGVLIPTKIEVTWNLPSGNFSYFQGEITEIEYNYTTTY